MNSTSDEQLGSINARLGAILADQTTTSGQKQRQMNALQPEIAAAFALRRKEKATAARWQGMSLAVRDLPFFDASPAFNSPREAPDPTAGTPTEGNDQSSGVAEIVGDAVAKAYGAAASALSTISAPFRRGGAAAPAPSAATAPVGPTAAATAAAAPANAGSARLPLPPPPPATASPGPVQSSPKLPPPPSPQQVLQPQTASQTQSELSEGEKKTITLHAQLNPNTGGDASSASVGASAGASQQTSAAGVFQRMTTYLVGGSSNPDSLGEALQSRRDAVEPAEPVGAPVTREEPRVEVYPYGELPVLRGYGPDGTLKDNLFTDVKAWDRTSNDVVDFTFTLVRSWLRDINDNDLTKKEKPDRVLLSLYGELDQQLPMGSLSSVLALLQKMDNVKPTDVVVISSLSQWLAFRVLTGIEHPDTSRIRLNPDRPSRNRKSDLYIYAALKDNDPDNYLTLPGGGIIGEFAFARGYSARRIVFHQSNTNLKSDPLPESRERAAFILKGLLPQLFDIEGKAVTLTNLGKNIFLQRDEKAADGFVDTYKKKQNLAITTILELPFSFIDNDMEISFFDILVTAIENIQEFSAAPERGIVEKNQDNGLNPFLQPARTESRRKIQHELYVMIIGKLFFTPLKSASENAKEAKSAFLRIGRRPNKNSELFASRAGLASFFRKSKSIYRTLTDDTGDAALYRRATRFIGALQAVEDAKFALDDTASGKRYTLLVPDNDAWLDRDGPGGQALPGLSSPANLNDTVRFHILLGNVRLGDLPDAESPDDGKTSEFPVYQEPGELHMQLFRVPQSTVDKVLSRPEFIIANGRKLRILDSVKAANGRIYLIDRLVPRLDDAQKLAKPALAVSRAAAHKESDSDSDSDSEQEVSQVRVPVTASLLQPLVETADAVSGAESAEQAASLIASGTHAWADANLADLKASVTPEAWSAAVDGVRDALAKRGYADGDAADAVDTLFNKFH